MRSTPTTSRSTSRCFESRSAQKRQTRQTQRRQKRRRRRRRRRRQASAPCEERSS